MSSRNIRLGLISSATILLGVQGALAGDGGSAFVGGLLGSAIGTAVTNSVIQQRQQRVYVQPRRYVPAPAVNTYQRAQNAQIQTALNYFGFDAGLADGVMGANSRAAIGQYQAFMSYPPTGVLTDYERTFLTSAYQRAIIGSPQDAQTIAASGQGTRGLLIAYRQEQTGAPMQAAVAPPVVVAPPVAPPTAVAAPQPAVVQSASAEPAAPPAASPAAAMPALPSFIPAAAAPSMAGVCNRTSIKTNANGGPVTLKVGQRIDPTQTFDEQFCLARTYAIDNGDALAATAQSFTAAQIEEQCVAFAPSMHDYARRLASQTPQVATEGLRQFVASTGIPPSQLSANARICLGVGYKIDDADVALASALVLVGLDDAAYEELVGYHLLDGFGTAARQDLGLDWIGLSVAALSSGAAPLVSANADNRLGLLQATLTMLASGNTEGPGVTDASATPGAAVVQDAATAPAPMALPVPKAASN